MKYLILSLVTLLGGVAGAFLGFYGLFGVSSLLGEGMAQVGWIFAFTTVPAGGLILGYISCFLLLYMCHKKQIVGMSYEQKCISKIALRSSLLLLIFPASAILFPGLLDRFLILGCGFLCLVHVALLALIIDSNFPQIKKAQPVAGGDATR